MESADCSSTIRFHLSDLKRYEPIAVALAAVLLTSVFIAPVHAQSHPMRYVATVWQTEQGLPTNSVPAMVAHEGYLWLATRPPPAYQWYEQRGTVDGFALDDWLQAEAEVLRAQRQRKVESAKDAT